MKKLVCLALAAQIGILAPVHKAEAVSNGTAIGIGLGALVLGGVAGYWLGGGFNGRGPGYGPPPAPGYAQGPGPGYIDNQPQIYAYPQQQGYVQQQGPVYQQQGPNIIDQGRGPIVAPYVAGQQQYIAPQQASPVIVQGGGPGYFGGSSIPNYNRAFDNCMTHFMACQNQPFQVVYIQGGRQIPYYAHFMPGPAGYVMSRPRQMCRRYNQVLVDQRGMRVGDVPAVACYDGMVWREVPGGLAQFQPRYASWNQAPLVVMNQQYPMPMQNQIFYNGGGPYQGAMNRPAPGYVPMRVPVVAGGGYSTAPRFLPANSGSPNLLPTQQTQFLNQGRPAVLPPTGGGVGRTQCGTPQFPQNCPQLVSTDGRIIR